MACYFCIAPKCSDEDRVRVCTSFVCVWCARARAWCDLYYIPTMLSHFSVLNDACACGCGQCGVWTADSPRFDHMFYFLANGFCHTSVSNTFRASVQRSAKKFRLRGMCSH